MAGKWLAKAKAFGGINKLSDWGRVLLDGNLFVEIIEQGTTAKFVGEDHFGNKYYENPDGPYTRKRFVWYKGQKLFMYNPSGIPPEWHAWLNYINDWPPTTHDYKKPVYAIESTISQTGHRSGYYQPKGALTHPNPRTWLKYEAWQPSAAAAAKS